MSEDYELLKTKRINSDRSKFFSDMTLEEWERYKRSGMREIPIRAVVKLEFIDTEHVVIDDDSDDIEHVITDNDSNDEDVYYEMFNGINKILMQKKEHLEYILSNSSNSTEIISIVNDISIFVKDILSIDCSDKERRMLIDFVERNSIIADIHLMVPKDSCTTPDYDIEM